MEVTAFKKEYPMSDIQNDRAASGVTNHIAVRRSALAVVVQDADIVACEVLKTTLRERKVVVTDSRPLSPACGYPTIIVDVVLGRKSVLQSVEQQSNELKEDIR